MTKRKKLYKMKQRLFSIGDDFYIENNDGDKVFKVDGKALRLRDTLIFEDLEGNELCYIQEKILSIKDIVKIERKGAGTAVVKKALFTLFRRRYTVHLEDGSKLKVKGDFLNHEYRIRSSDGIIARVSKRWFRLRDTYGVQISPNIDDILILAITVVIDVMSQKIEARKQRQVKHDDKKAS